MPNNTINELNESENVQTNFIEDIINEELISKQNRVHTRFPPEPNGYLHIGHAKAICINFNLAKEYNGKCNLRMDDTNPAKEDMEYVNAIIEDIHWLGFEYDGLYFASDYYEKFYEYATILIKKGLAYVCDLTAEEIKEYRGTLTQKGKNSPFRERPVEENLELFAQMRQGKFADGEKTLRAKIDMQSPNLNMRDPIIYRIARAYHFRTKNEWCIYPMYDFAHPISDAIEGITHSLCSLEFEDHRPLYDWFLQNIGAFPLPPRQIEFARLALNQTVMSKRYLKWLVDTEFVDGWDDPRMPTISGIRRRGYTGASIRNFCEMIGVSKSNSIVDMGMLEHCVRDDLNKTSTRVMAIMNPVKLTITNWQDDKTETISLENNPNVENSGNRTINFEKNIFIDQNDFMIDPPKKYFRLYPGSEVRLKGAYIVKCESYDVDESGQVTNIYCTYDPDSKSGESTRKVKGTIQWLPQSDYAQAEIHSFEPLLLPDESGTKDFKELLNDNSIKISNAYVESFLKNASPGERYQFIRVGYYCIDKNSSSDKLVFNNTVGLKDTWAKQAKK